uniref:Bromo domain-containing protein n=1 Tax=Haemonchus placei TaxID=6290 RepID=A0A0N4WUJ4_HAEPC
LLTHDDLFCIGHRLCSKRDVRIKRVHLLRMVGEILEKIDTDPGYASKISYDEYPTDDWDVPDMRDVEEIFDALCATAHFHGWSYTKLMPMAMVLYVANFHFNDFTKYFVIKPETVMNSRKRNSESDSLDFHNENGSSLPSTIKRGLSMNELCYKVLLCCYEHAECASCFAQPVPENTPGYYKVIQNPMDLGTIAAQLQNSSVTGAMSVSEFIEKMNTVFRNCSKFNPKNSPVAEAGRRVWQSYQSAVKKYLPSYTKDIWLYVSLHDRKVSLQKRRKRSLSKNDLKTPRLSSVQ